MRLSQTRREERRQFGKKRRKLQRFPIKNKLKGQTMNLGEKIRKYRMKKGLSQNQLAVLSGVKQPVLCRVESGVARDMRAGNVARIAEALGIPVDQLLTDRKIPTNDYVSHDRDALRLVETFFELDAKERVQLLDFAEYLKRKATNL